MSQVTATRYHDISCGHRVVGHEGKCRHLHGHNYRVHFTCKAANLDSVGRVVDFSVIKERLCSWIEHEFDHKFLVWEHDPMFKNLRVMGDDPASSNQIRLDESLVFVPFNPTAENIALYLLHVVGPKVLEGAGCTLVKVAIEETRKCSAEVSLNAN